MLKFVDNGGRNGIIKNIGIDNIYPKDYKGTIKREVAEEINKVIQKRNATSLFDGAKIVKINSKNVLQTEVIQNGTFFDVVLNINENALGGKTIQEIDDMFKGASSTIANTLEEAVIHEEFHARLVAGLNYAQVEALYDELSDIHIGGISKIAYADGAECIPETGVLIVRNETDKIPEEALNLFKKYIRGVI